MYPQETKAHGKSALTALSDVLGGSVDFVWQAKARAELAREREEAMAKEEALSEPKLRETSAEAEAMVMALMQRFGGKPDADVERAYASITALHKGPTGQARAPGKAKAAPVKAAASLYSGDFAKPDDKKEADATWLHFELGQVPALARAGALRTNMARRDKYPRGVWRAAFAALLQKLPNAVCSGPGYLISQARRIAADGVDPRLGSTFCVAAGWGEAAYRAAGCEGYVHQVRGCRCDG